MEQEKMVKGKKAEGKEVTAQMQNQFVNQKMGAVRKKGVGLGAGDKSGDDRTQLSS